MGFLMIMIMMIMMVVVVVALSLRPETWYPWHELYIMVKVREEK